MNKKLVAAALGLVFAAPVFADASNVTLYGRVHTVLDSQSTENGGADQGGNFTQENVASRLGVRGQEDLGGGLSVIFAYEFGVASDVGGFGSGRHAYVGLKSDWGTFTAGQLDGGNDGVAPMYDQASKIGSVSNNGGPLTTVGGGAIPGGAVLAATGPFPTTAIERTQRTGNSFGYKHTIGGVAIAARHAMSGGVNDQNANIGLTDKENDIRSSEITADYKIGGLSIGAGYEHIDAQERTQIGLDASTQIENRIQAVASYNFGSFSIGGLVAQSSLPVAAANGDDSNIEYAISGTLPLAANSGIFAMYANAERNDLQVASPIVGNPSISTPVEIQQAQIAYYYDFSKRTRTYVGFNRTEGELQVAGGGEVTQDNFTIGLRHNF